MANEYVPAAEAFVVAQLRQALVVAQLRQAPK